MLCHTQSSDVRNAIGGSHSAFDRLCRDDYVQRWLLAIAAALPSRLRSKVSPEDILQDALQSAWTHVKEFEGQHSGLFYRWVLTICRNRVFHIIRSFDSNKRNLSMEVDQLPSAVTLPSRRRMIGATMVFRDQVGVIADVMDELPETVRQVILMHIVEELPYEEIARITGKSNTAVRSITKRGLDKITQLMKSRGYESTMLRCMS